MLMPMTTKITFLDTHSMNKMTSLQALDWKIRHKHTCMPIDDWLDVDTDDDEGYPEEEIEI
jgi:hypothetical protein